MDNLKRRLTALTPAQRELLEQKMKQRGWNAPLPKGVQTAEGRELPPLRRTHRETSRMDFSLFFFSGDGTNETDQKYQLLLESAKFADQHGFSAVWTPERHFQAFGGLYPNPSVMSAALSMITNRIQIRSGSVAVPLHHPVRVAEEWAVVDNLSHGRVAISCASGWHSDDFVLAPEPRLDRKENRRSIMFENIASIRALWRGDSVSFPGIDGEPVRLRAYPRPIQKELPIWISSQGSTETFVKAGMIGANLLTGLAGQTLEGLKEKIRLYREAREENAHETLDGKVAVMLHTFLGSDNDVVKKQVYSPLTQYLQTFIAQQKNADSVFQQMGEEDREQLVDLAFENYFETLALLGTPEKCEHLLEELVDIGVDEVACLIDFGLPTETVLEGLEHLWVLQKRYARTENPSV